MKYGLHGAVLAALVAVPVAFAAADTTVHLTVDGRTVAIDTSADTVGQVLADRHLRVGPHDLVAPSTSSRVTDGARIVLRHGHLLRLTVDGRATSVWTTAPTVDSALDALGYTESDFVSVSRSRRLPLTPTSVQVRTPQVVTVVHDGRRDAVTTTDATVGELLTDLRLTVGPIDRLSAPTDAALRSGAVVDLQRVKRVVTSKTVAVAFPTTKHKDSSLDAGTTKVVHKGVKGQSRVTYATVFVDGKNVGSTQLSSVTVVEPTAQVEKVGTRKVDVPANTPDAPAPSPGSAQAIAKRLLAKHGWGDDQFSCLVQMWNRESGWRTDAANPSGAYGIPQALPGSKMASAGPDWQSDATTQITWGIGYIQDRYNTPCGAWTFWQAHNYY